MLLRQNSAADICFDESTSHSFHDVFNVHFHSQVNHAEHHTTGCQVGVYILASNMAGRSEDESVSNSSRESR